MQKQRLVIGVWIVVLILGASLLGGCGVAKQIVIDPTGKGTHTTIRDGLGDWKEGQEIIINPGTYDEQVILQSNMNIKGKSAGDVKVVFSGDGPAIVGRDVLNVKVSGISFAKSNFVKHSTAVMNSSDVEISQCTFSGSNTAGVEALKFGNLILKDSDIRDNGYAGVFFHDRARGKLIKNRIHSNDQGVVLQRYPNGKPAQETQYRDEVDLVDVTIEENTISSNRKNGLYFTAGSQAVVTKNTISTNAVAGAYVTGGSEGAFTENQILGNGNGLHIAASDIRVASNQIAENTKVGVIVDECQKATVVGNEITANQSGIQVRVGGESLIQANRIYQNKENGIEIVEGARPTVEQNWILQNEKVGMVVMRVAKPLIRYNVVAANAWHGLLVAKDAKPVVHNNTFYRNKKIGAWFLERSEGVFMNNVIAGSVIGLSIRRNLEFKPEVRNNAFWENERKDHEGFIETPKYDFNEDPMFKDVTKLDFTPLPGSPLVRKEGDKRIVVGAIDPGTDISKPEEPITEPGS